MKTRNHPTPTQMAAPAGPLILDQFSHKPIKTSVSGPINDIGPDTDPSQIKGMDFFRQVGLLL